jgi:hypothetical protein
MSEPQIVMSAPLPMNFRGTPQQWFEAMVARLELLGLPTGFVTGDTMPTSNQGPWLKGGTEIWVWDETASPPTYVPQSLSFLTQQVWIGDKSTPPDETKYTIWLQTDGTNFYGWAVWLGPFVKWVSPSSGIQPDSVTTDMLQKPAVYRDNIADGEVVSSKIQNDLPIAKLAMGTANQLIQMRGGVPTWDNFFKVSPNLDWGNNRGTLWAHGLGQVPTFVQATLVCVAPSGGFAVGTEINLPGASRDYGGNEGDTPQITRDATNVGCYVRNGISLLDTSLDAPFDVSSAYWKLKFYVR